ncbi:ATP-dependent RNA helicase DDX19A-like [Amphiura filiformis]|uniref:ATP-dependent RNA helicase DDX19A-like n=1 Tax=Amphiura filiformis TaxID=82378 RepID=UPI003B21FC23
MADLDWDKAIEAQEKGDNLADKVQDLKLKGEGDEKPSSSNSSSTASAAVADGGNTNEKQKGAGEGEEEKELGEEKADASLFNKLVHNKLVEVTQSSMLDVLQKDPNSPLYSVKSFEELRLKEELLKGVYLMGFNAPSKIQETALPLLLADPPKNMIAQSQSGTGKTAAFVLTMLSRVDGNKEWPQALCLAPTFELALQIGAVVEEMGKCMTDVKIRYSVRGQRVARGERIKEQIVIGTPGTTLDWGLKWKAIDLSKVQVFVLDEADVMIATQGHQDQSIRIQKKLPKTCQMMLFSATYEESVMKFAEAVIPDPIVIRLRRDEESLENIKQYYVMCNNEEEKYEALANIYGAISIGQAIIFCRTKRTANWLTEKMTRDGHAVGLLSGELQVEQRVAVLKRYREGKEKVLITTNVMARGIDIEQVTVVVNFDLPTDQYGQPDCETYLHRIGRTGRFGKQGLAINFVDGPRSMANLQKIEQHFGREIHRLAADDAEEIEKIV